MKIRQKPTEALKFGKATISKRLLVIETFKEEENERYISRRKESWESEEPLTKFDPNGKI